MESRLMEAGSSLLRQWPQALDKVHLCATNAKETAKIGLPTLEPEVLFPVGSVTKLFLGVAIARWLDADPTLSLDSPASDLIGQRAQGRRLTLRHLVTHTAGFDSIDSGIVAAQDTSLEAAPAAPRFVRPAGGLPAYSNYGSALAALILERVHGAPIEEILRRDVFQPLGMNSARLIDDTANVARLPGQAAVRRVHPFFRGVGAAACTSDDALRFARFLLAAAQGRATGIVSQRGAALLTTPLVGPRDGSMGVGLFATIVRRPELRLVGHTGSWVEYAAFLAALPDADVGLFGAMLQPESAPISTDRVWGGLVSGFLAATPTVSHALSPHDLVGRYVSSKRCASADLPMASFDGSGVTQVRALDAEELEIVGAGRFEAGRSGEIALRGSIPVGLSGLAMAFERDELGRLVLWRAFQREAHLRAGPFTLTRPTRRLWAIAILLGALAAGVTALANGALAPLAAIGWSALAWAGVRWQTTGLRTLEGDRRGVRYAKAASWALVATIVFGAARDIGSGFNFWSMIGYAACTGLVGIHSSMGLLGLRAR